MRLRQTTPADLDWVVRVEAHPDVSPYVGAWPHERHLRAIEDPAEAHLVIEREGEPEPERLGYVLLAGLGDPSRSLELRRIVCAERGRRHGRKALALVLSHAFTDLGRHRVWLDVIVDNERARHAYRAAGFVEEGVLRDAFLSPCGFHSLAVMSVLRPDWEARPR